MKYILSREGLEVLQRFAWSNVLLAFDFDGTLAPIVSKPGAAAIRRTTKTLLTQVGHLYPCAVISGRTRGDTARRVAGVTLSEVVGNHGVERSRNTATFARIVETWRAPLEQGLAKHPGVHIEDKGLSLSIHYRHARRKKEAKAAILAVTERLSPLRIVGGKQVFNLIPEGAGNKGTALERIRANFRCDTAVYVGDDDTDEDVFALDQPGQLLTIRVGAKRTSSAHYFLRSQTEIDALLRFFVRAKRNVSSRRRHSA